MPLITTPSIIGARLSNFHDWMSTYAGLSYDDTYLYAITKYDAPITDVAGACEITYPKRIPAYGEYEWRARFNAVGANRLLYAGFCQGYPDGWRNAIFVNYDGTDYRFQTISGGTVTSDVLVAQDWTVERLFRVVWRLNLAQLYIDDVLVDTIVANVPSTSMVIFFEVGFIGAAAGAPDKIITTRDWRCISL